MRRSATGTVRAALLAAFCLSTSGCAGWRNWQPRVTGYHCQTEADGPFGHISVNASLSPDGTRVRYQTSWTADLEEGRLSLRMDWRGPVDAPPSTADLLLALTPDRRHWGRLEFRRDGPQGALVHATSSSNPPYRWWETLRWDRFSNLMGDASALHVAVVARRPRFIVAEAEVPRQILAAPGEAAAAIRPQLEQDLADYATRCAQETDPPMVIS